jgi:hypothetical protein
VDFYRVYRNGALLTALTATTNTYVDKAVITGTTYTYYTLAINTGGQTSSNQVPITARCEAPPGTFTLTVTPWCNGTAPVNELHWTAPVGVTFPYETYRNNVLVFTSDLNLYEDTAVMAGVTYSYLVRAKNAIGTRDSNIVPAMTRSDCAVPPDPVIDTVSPQTVTVGSGSFTLTITGRNFNSTSRIAWGFSGQSPTAVIIPTFVSGNKLTVQVAQNSGGFSPFINPGGLALQVLNPGPNFWDGQKSNIVALSTVNPISTVSSVTGTCRAGFNCTPANGFDVKIQGSGFVNNIAFVGGDYVSSTYAEMNGSRVPVGALGQGPVFNAMQLFVNGTIIPTAGTYSVRVCNAATTVGTSCSTGSLTVTP